MKEAVMSTPTIEVSGLGKTYPGGVEAVKGIDFDVAPGEVFGLLGPNGAGKSTTIGMLTTTVRPTSGRARVAGFDVTTHPRAARGVSAVVFQEAVVDRSLTGWQNFPIHGRLLGMEPAGRIVALDAPRALLDGLGRELVEVRVGGDVQALLSFLRAHGAATDDAYAVGATVTVPLREQPAHAVLDAVTEFGAPIVATTTRPPTLDDVYLRLTGDRLAAA